MDEDNEIETQPKNSVLAIIAAVTGLISFVFAPAGLLAVVLGHASLFTVKRSNGRIRGKVLGVFALIMGYLALIILIYNRSK